MAPFYVFWLLLCARVKEGLAQGGEVGGPVRVLIRLAPPHSPWQLTHGLLWLPPWCFCPGHCWGPTFQPQYFEIPQLSLPPALFSSSETVSASCSFFSVAVFVLFGFSHFGSPSLVSNDPGSGNCITRWTHGWLLSSHGSLCIRVFLLLCPPQPSVCCWSVQGGCA